MASSAARVDREAGQAFVECATPLRGFGTSGRHGGTLTPFRARHGAAERHSSSASRALCATQGECEAIVRGAPLAELPPAFRALQQRMFKTPGGDREMVEILALVLQHDEQAALTAVELALEGGHADEDAYPGPAPPPGRWQAGRCADCEAAQRADADHRAASQCRALRRHAPSPGGKPCAIIPPPALFVIMLRSLKMHGMAQAVGELTEQGSLSLCGRTADADATPESGDSRPGGGSTAYRLKAARFPNYRDLAGFDFASELRSTRRWSANSTDASSWRTSTTHSSSAAPAPSTSSGGKTHLATAIGVRAIEHHRSQVRFFSTVDTGLLQKLTTRTLAPESVLPTGQNWYYHVANDRAREAAGWEAATPSAS